MRIRRKTRRCLNCKAPLAEVYNYCPQCGQENNDNNVSLGTLLGEFFSNYFSVDSRLMRTLKPFLTKPGTLTLRFIEGQRMRYLHPIRLYLVISVLYFFALGIFANNSVSWEDVLRFENDSDVALVAADSAQGSQNSVVFGGDTIRWNDSLVMDSSQWKGLADLGITPDSLMKVGVGVDSVIKNTRDRSRQFMAVMRNDTITDEEAAVMLEMEDLDESIFRQFRRVVRKDLDIFIPYVIKNIPLMMFLILPLFALLLKLLYLRHRQYLYIQHLIHGLHIHSFGYLLFSLALLVMLWGGDSGEFRAAVAAVTFILHTTYVFVSFLRVYKEHWVITLLKFWVLGGLYFGLLMFGLIGEAVLSFFLF